MTDNASDAITVTRFEQLEKPTLLVAPPTKQIALIRASAPPAHFYRYLLSLLPDSEIAHQRSTFSDTAIGEIIHHADVALYVLHVDGVPAGMSEIDRRSRLQARIACAGIANEFANPHLNRYLLAQAIALAWSNETERVLADVTSRDRKGTLSLFQSCGFTVYEQSTEKAAGSPKK